MTIKNGSQELKMLHHIFGYPIIIRGVMQLQRIKCHNRAEEGRTLLKRLRWQILAFEITDRIIHGGRVGHKRWGFTHKTSLSYHHEHRQH